MGEVEFFENFEIKKYSTFKIGGKAKRVFIPKNKEEFLFLLNSLKNPVILGGGSNTLFSSSFIEKNIILTSYLDNYNLEDDILTVETGTKGAKIANLLSQRGLTGLEFLIGFPAYFGGAIYQNASAQGQAIEDTFLNATVFDCDNKKTIKLSKDDMKFGYRYSILRDKNYILLNAQFKLLKSDVETAKAKIQQNIDFRKQHQPMLTLPNIGSIFKNPIGNSAGKLFDELGVKGVNIGGACVWQNHANFIININGATSLDVLKLMYKMKKMVLDKYNINLKPEINFINGDNEEETELWTFLQK